MLRKRIVGIVTIRNGWAVQSFGYKRWLPIGKPEHIVENLDRWGADEIVLQVIDRSRKHLGPDFELISHIASRGLATPLVYGGGIRHEADAVQSIRAGADRICVDAMLHSNPGEIHNIVRSLGAQAVIATLPLAVDGLGQVSWYNYLSDDTSPIHEDVSSLMDEGLISEALVIDCKHEGHPTSFDFRVLTPFVDKKIQLILFGGISEASQVEQGLSFSNVSAIAVGNFLNYREHAIQRIKDGMTTATVRPSHYSSSHGWKI